MTGLRGVLVRLLLGLLVGFGVLAALFRIGRPRQRNAVPAPSTTAAPSTRLQVRPAPRPGGIPARGLALTGLVLLLGTGLILAVSSGGGMRWFAAASRTDGAAGGPVAVLSGTEAGSGTKAGGARDAAAAPGTEMPAGVGAADPERLAFDVVRVAPDGQTVVAGQAPPDSVVDLLIDGKPVAQVRAGADGRFALSPLTLPTGSSELGLRATPDGKPARRSEQTVAVAVSPSRDAQPLVALTAPDQPTRVWSRPDGAAQAVAGPGARESEASKFGARGLEARGLEAKGLEAKGPEAMGPEASKPEAARPGAGGSPRDRADAAAIRGPSGSDPVAGGPASRTDGGPALSGAADAAVGDGRDRPAGPSRPGPAIRRDAGADDGSSPVKIVTIDAPGGGRLFVTGQAGAGAAVRLYLNDTLIAPASVGRDGTVTFTIGQGLKAGDYTVRLDQIDAATGRVRSRAEVPFSVPGAERTAEAGRPALHPPPPAGAPADALSDAPAGGRVATPERPVASSEASGADRQADGAGRGAPGPAQAGSTPAAQTAEVFVPEITVARIVRGDNLWEISRRLYGAGDRYTVIYEANQDQIRNPDLIYPGQVFVLPMEGTVGGAGVDKRG